MSNIVRPFAFVLLASAALTLQPSSRCTADEPHSGWERLPASTIAAVRLASSPELAEQMIEETQFGALFLDDARLARFAEITIDALEGSAREGSPASKLAEQEWSPDELLGMFSGEMGIAYIGDRTEDFAPCVSVWASPSDETADKLWDIINQLVDDEVEDSDDVKSLDADVNDADAFWLNLSVPGGSINTIFAKRGNHLVVSLMPKPIIEDDEDACIDFLTEQVERLLSEDLPSSERFEFADGLPQPERASDAEQSFFEAAVNGPLLSKTIIEQSQAPEEEVERIARLTGFEQIGWLTFSMAYGDQLMRQDLQLQWPSPRIGLGQLLDIEQEAFDPPKWLPSTAHTVSQGYLELDAVFSIIEENVRREFPSTASGFEIVKGQAKALLQVDLVELLGALGPRVTSLVFPLDSEIVAQALENESGELQEPTAIVVELGDQDLVEDFARSATAFAPPGGIEETDEQGYFGLRVNGAPIELAAAIGDGYLIVGLGEGVLEKTIVAIKNPPSGKDSFVGSDTYDIGLDMLSGEPGMRIDIADGNTQQQAAFKALESIVTQMQTVQNQFGGDDPAFSLFEAMLAELPSPEESEGTLGVMVNELRADNDGLHLESVVQLPPPN